MANVVSSRFGKRNLVELPPVNSATRTAAKGVTHEDNSNEVARAGFDYRSDNAGIAKTRVADNSWNADPRSYVGNRTVTIKQVYKPGIEQFNIVEPVMGPNGPYLQFSPRVLGRKQTVQVEQQYPQPVQGQYLQPAQGQYSQQVQGQKLQHVQGQYSQTVRGQYPQRVQGQNLQHVQGQYLQAVQGQYPSNTSLQYAQFPTQQGVVYLSQPTVQVTTAQLQPAGQGNTYSPQAVTAPTAQFQTNNPNEKHIFYGPDGNVVSGPPAGFHSGNSMPAGESNTYQNDFLVEAILEYGKVKSLMNLNNTSQFPQLPDYLLRHLEQTYGEYEKTDARIVYRDGQFHVHGAPQLPGSGQMTRLPPPFDHLSEPHRYGTPPNSDLPYGYEYM